MYIPFLDAHALTSLMIGNILGEGTELMEGNGQGSTADGNILIL